MLDSELLPAQNLASETISVVSYIDIPISRSSWFAKVYGADIEIIREKMFFPLSDKQQEFPKQLKIGDVIFCYLRRNNPNTDELEKLFYGVAIVIDPQIDLVWAPSLQKDVFGFKAKLICNEKVALWRVSKNLDFMALPNIGSKIATGYLPISGSDADLLLWQLKIPNLEALRVSS